MAIRRLATISRIGTTPDTIDQQTAAAIMADVTGLKQTPEVRPEVADQEKGIWMVTLTRIQEAMLHKHGKLDMRTKGGLGKVEVRMS